MGVTGRKYKLSTLAEQDLISIYHYGANKFGALHAESYFLELKAKIELLAKNPSITNRFYTDLTGHHFSVAVCGRHLIYYKTADWGILVVRILSQRMDPDNQIYHS